MPRTASTGSTGEAEVMGMIQGVRNFMLSYPA